MANLTINNTDNKFHYPTSGKGTVNLGTANTFLDRDIVIEDPVAGVGSQSTTTNSAIASGSATGFTVSTTATSYYVTPSASSSWSAKKTVTAGGYIAKNTAVEVSGSKSNVAGEPVYIPTNSIKGSVDSLTKPSVVLSPGISGMATSSTETAYSVTPTGTVTKGSVKGKATAGGTTGIVAANASNTSSASEIDVTKSGETATYIQEAKVTLSGSTSSVKPTATQVTAPSTIAGHQVNVAPSTSVPTDAIGYYIAFKPQVGATTITPTATITEGYLPNQTSKITGSVKATSRDGDTHYLKLPKATKAINQYATSAPSSTGYDNYYTFTPSDKYQMYNISSGYNGTNDCIVVPPISSGTSATYNNVASLPNGATAWADTPIITSGGYLHITAGYTPERYLPLSKLVPDVATITTSTSDKLLTGESAYDKNGTLITGSMRILNSGDISLGTSLSNVTADTVSTNNVSFNVTYDIGATPIRDGYFSDITAQDTQVEAGAFSLPRSKVTGGLHSNSGNAYPTTYDVYRISASVGYMPNVNDGRIVDINVYQGAYTTA